MQHSGKIGFISLGCAKATVDSERILTELRIRGYQISADYKTSDLIIVNTCGFIDSAIEESLQAIGEAIDENGKVIVTGCLGAKGNIVKQHYDKVLAVTGPQETQQVIDAVTKHLPIEPNPYTDLIPPGGLKLTPRHYAYLKISEGCNHHCRFCIIPQMRGKLVSRPAAEVMAEAEALASAGVRELLVVSQDTSAYGSDLKYQSGFYSSARGTVPIRSHIYDLSKALGSLGIWVRLHYVYPYPHVDELIPLMADGLLLPYLDIPFQHASETVLKSMRRPAHSEKVLHRIENWRKICPEITIRSTFIVGFPGETEQDFEQLLDFLKQAKIDRVGCFQYSNVDGAAANQIENQISDEIKQQRFHRLMSLQSEISKNCLSQKIGQEQMIMLDQVNESGGIGRTMGDAPEVDGIVQVDSLNSEFSPGDRIKVRITDSTDYDLIATPA